MDLKARIRNKAFWVALFAAVILLAQQVGLELPFEKLTNVFNAALGLLTVLGIFVDPTTPGVSDGRE